MADKFKYTVLVNATFEYEGGYPEAQNYIIQQLMEHEPQTHMNIQSLQLIRWTTPGTDVPVVVNRDAPNAVNPTENDE